MGRRLPAEPSCFLSCLFCVLFLSIEIISAQTNVGGLISSDVTWTKSNSPYIVTGNTLVNEGITLTIEPGVVVKFGNSRVLQINGTLIARGTSKDTIRFTSNQASPKKGDWGYVYLTNLSTSAVFDKDGSFVNGSILEYAVIEYAGILNNQIMSAILLDNAGPSINHCLLRNNYGDAIGGTTLTEIKVRNSQICWNSNMAINVQGPMQVDSCILTDNQNGINHNYKSFSVTNSIIKNNNGYGLRHSSFYESHALLIKVMNCLVIDNKSDGIFITCDSDSSEMFIVNNIVKQNGGRGINTYLGWYREGTIANNIVMNNSVEGIFSSASDPTIYIKENIVCGNGTAGIYSTVRNSGRTKIFNNIIAGNRGYGVDASSASLKCNGIYFNNSIGIKSYNGDTILSNSMYGNNILDSASSYCFYINGTGQKISSNNIIPRSPTIALYNDNPSNTSSLKAANNWWGTTDDTVIQRRIHDWFDDASKSIVDYAPYSLQLDTIAPILPPANLKGGTENGYVLLSWSRNKEADFKGYKIHLGDSIIDIGDTTMFGFNAPGGLDSIAVTAYDNAADGVNDLFEGHESWYSYASIKGKSFISRKQNDNRFGMQLNSSVRVSLSSNTVLFSIGSGAAVDISLYDVVGKRLQTVAHSYMSPGKYEYPIKPLSNGMYLIMTKINSTIYSTPFIKRN
jgi:hypothetical protein